MRKLAIAGVMGSGSDPHTPYSYAIGQLLAARPLHLLTGGGGGVMTAVSEAFGQVEARRGLVIGVLPSTSASDGTPKSGYPNAAVELVIQTHLPLSAEHGTDVMSRNHINILSSDIVIVLPGGAGTRAEAGLALRYDKPCIAYGEPGKFAGFPEGLTVTSDIKVVEAFVAEALAGVVCT